MTHLKLGFMFSLNQVFLDFICSAYLVTLCLNIYVENRYKLFKKFAEPNPIIFSHKKMADL